MSDQLREFGGIARGLARNPLGIIALFIVLVYGFASMVTAFSGAFTSSEKLPLIYFLVGFPVLVLVAFTWLVSKHSGKLFAPSDFKDETNYVKMQLSAVASLTAAATKNHPSSSEATLQNIVSVVQDVSNVKSEIYDGWRGRILWVDDRPDNNIYERRAFEAVGLSFSLALSTDEALRLISTTKFAAIISDMGRREGPREGYVLLDSVRSSGDETPFFIYAASNSAEHKKATHTRGGQGCTNNPDELFQMVTQAVLRQAIASSR